SFQFLATPRQPAARSSFRHTHRLERQWYRRRSDPGETRRLTEFPITKFPDVVGQILLQWRILLGLAPGPLSRPIHSVVLRAPGTNRQPRGRRVPYSESSPRSRAPFF